MSSVIQAILTSIQQSDYISLVIITVVVYDYVLTFSSEVEFIWNKPWTRVSTLFLLIRYLGLCTVILVNVYGGTFTSASAEAIVCVYSSLTVITLNMLEQFLADFVAQWVFFVFMLAADFIMTLRVWAMYNRSKVVLYAMLAIFVAANALNFSVAVYYNVLETITAITIPYVNISICIQGYLSPTLAVATSAVQLVLSITMCILVIVRFVRELIGMYRATKMLQFNRYTKLLVREGILYFLTTQLDSLIDLLSMLGTLPTTGSGLLLTDILQYIPIFTLIPRFVLNMRQLYADDVQGNRAGGIDTAFGLGTLSGRGTVMTEIEFADVREQNEATEQAEEVVQEVGRDTGVA